MDQDALKQRLRALFIEELDEHVAALTDALLTLEREPSGADTSDVVNQMFRSVHSLKGAAHAASVPPVEALCHALEDAMADMRDSDVQLERLARLFPALDVLTEAARQLREGRDEVELPVAEVVRTLSAPLAHPARPQVPPTAMSADPPLAGRAPSAAAAPVTPSPQATASDSDRAQPDALPLAPVPTSMRIATARLEALLDSAGEVLLASQRVHEVAATIAKLREEVTTQSAAWRVAAGSVTGADEATTGATLDQLLDRGSRNWSALGERLELLTRLASASDRHLTRAAGDLADGARQARMAPFIRACEGLERVARDVARTAEKDVHLDIEGGDVELDRPILEVLRGPLVHLVRNAVDHGIEAPDVREGAGKPRAGHVVVSAVAQATTIAVTVTDDGAGIDRQALRAAAARAGALQPADDQHVLDLAFAPGVSTAAEITQVSGRGVGLDAVRTAVEAVGGSVRLAADAEAGTSVVLTVPVTLAVMRVLVVAVADEVFALPTGSVIRPVRAAINDVRTLDEHEVLWVEGRPIRIVPLRLVLGFGPVAAPNGHIDGVLVGEPGEETMLTVDALIDEREIVLKPPGTRLAALPAVLGATVVNGRVALILNPPACVRLGRGRSETQHAAALPASTRPTRVLLAEDTRTTRVLERSILEAAGYDVLVAVDGLEAWELLEQHGADIIVSDVDMPRLSGLELCQRVRRSPAFRELPFVLVTSLGDDDDRRRGADAGADAYIVKSEFEQSMLLDAVERLS